jgi:lipid-A-disaccharide synthase
MKIMISAGEVSGDIHGAYLVKELKKLNPNIYFYGVGSEKLQAEGVDVKFDITRRGTIGFSEALPYLVPLYVTFLKTAALMKAEKPDLLLLIDSQGYNLPLAKAAKKLGIKTAYYIPPQEWLWGTGRGVKNAAKIIGLIISIFEKEHEVYKQAGGNSVYFGHPLLDIVKSSSSKKQNGPSIAICPGSRTQEIKGLLPILLKAADKIKAELPNARFIIPAASARVAKMIPGAVVGKTYEVLASSDLAICTSGTINLEASILGVPNIMVYKLSPLSYLIGKYIFKIKEKVPYFTMPNFLLQEKVIPELVMGDATPERIAEEALSILKDSSRQKRMKESFEKLKARLGSPGAISRCAKAILEFAQHSPKKAY